MDFNQYIDYTVLKLGATTQDIETLCQQAIEQNYKAVCVSPTYVPLASQLVAGTPVSCCTVVGFPHGMHLTNTKIVEAQNLIAVGAQELDIVSNLAYLRNKQWEAIRSELTAFQAVCADHGVLSKVIIESGLLELGEIKSICEICTEAGVDYVKTSTGFAGVGAELEKVRYMREILPDHMLIKASGGIRDYETAQAFIQAGASRIGTSSLIIPS